MFLSESFLNPNLLIRENGMGPHSYFSYWQCSTSDINPIRITGWGLKCTYNYMIPFLVCFGSLEMRELPIDFLNLQQYILPFLTVRLEDLENISFHFVPSKRNGTYNTQTYGLLEFADSLGSDTELIWSRLQALTSSADLEVQLVQLNHCDGVYSNY